MMPETAIESSHIFKTRLAVRQKEFDMNATIKQSICGCQAECRSAQLPLL